MACISRRRAEWGIRSVRPVARESGGRYVALPALAIYQRGPHGKSPSALSGGAFRVHGSGHGYGRGVNVLVVGGAEVHPCAVAHLRWIARCPGARAQEQVQGTGVGPDRVRGLTGRRELRVVAEEGPA